MSGLENAIEQAKQYASAGIEKATELGHQAINAVKEQLGEATTEPTTGITRKASAGPLADEEEKKLADAIAHRPTPEELMEKNILKKSNAAPALQAKQEKLKQQQLKDSLDAKIALRSSPEELVQKNILKDEPNHMVGGVQAGVNALEKAKIEDTIESKLETRPDPTELIREGILDKNEDPRIA